MLPFILLIRHQQNPFKDVKRASSEKIKGWGMELFYILKIIRLSEELVKIWNFQEKKLLSFKLYLFLSCCCFAKSSAVLCRSSRSQMLFNIGVLKNVANFTGKYLCRGLLLIKLQAPPAYNLIKKRLQQGCFPVNSA